MAGVVMYSLKTKQPLNRGGLVDEEALLTEEDKQRKNVLPSSASEEGCGPSKRKACKNCTCGLAKQLQQQAGSSTSASASASTNSPPVGGDASSVTTLSPEGAPQGGCGNCAKGDAFRCSTCPFRGKPAWKPGEAVKLTSTEDSDALQ